MRSGSVGRAALALWLAGCHTSRVVEVQQRVLDLRAEVALLVTQADELHAVLAARPPPTRAVRMDLDPEGFDASRPLPSGDPRRPDVILLSIDTLRADHLGTYGYSRDTSPFFDTLGAEGTVYEQAWSPTSWTLPSHTTMLSGQNPVRHGAIDDHIHIPGDVPLLQERFRAAGYGTVGAVATLFVSSRYGFDRGFDHFVDFGIRNKHLNNLSTVDADQVFHQALDWAQKQPEGKPLFLFLHVYDAHYQYDPPPPWNEKFDRPPMWGDEVYKNYEAYKRSMVPAVQLAHQVAQYDEEIAFVDDSFRQLIETWRGAGREAVILVTADHGEEFGERGSWGHAHTLWPEQLHVPFIVNGPGVPSQRLQARIGTEDIAPTLAGLAGIGFDALDGVDRSPEIRSGDAPERDHESAMFASTSRFDSLVYRWHDGSYDLYVDIVAGDRALCQVSSDPKCKVNLYRKDKDRAEGMFHAMNAWLGEPWQAAASGRIEAIDGFIFASGDRKDQVLDVVPGQKFAVEPGDAKVLFHTPEAIFGPWRPLGGSIPGARCPVKYSGRYLVNAELSAKTAEETELLEQLGYMQGDEEPAEAVAPSGPESCP